MENSTTVYTRYTVEEKCLCTICFVWSKTTLITGSVGGAVGILPFVKWGHIFYVPDTNWAEFQQFPIKWSKTTLITGSVGGAGMNPPYWKTSTFFFDPWLLVCQFIEISNQMELTFEISNFE